MIPKGDPTYAAMLVASARLHLGTVMTGQASEHFFSDMLRIIEGRFYLGYTTLQGKEAKLRGIKDFIHNVHYGLGVRDMQTFLCAVAKAAYKEQSKARYGYRFIDWLKAEDPVFDFPRELFEYRRLVRATRFNRKLKRVEKMKEYNILRMFYQNHPHLLYHIGPGKKYPTPTHCYFGEGFSETRKTLKPIKLFRNPTVFQLSQTAEVLVNHLGPGRSKILVSQLIDCIENRKTADSSGAGAGVHAASTELPRPGWEDELDEVDITEYEDSVEGEAEGGEQPGDWPDVDVYP